MVDSPRNFFKKVEQEGSREDHTKKAFIEPLPGANSTIVASPKVPICHTPPTTTSRSEATPAPESPDSQIGKRHMPLVTDTLAEPVQEAKHTVLDATEEINVMLQPDDINFPKLHTSPQARGSVPQVTDSPIISRTNFVWQSKNLQLDTPIQKSQSQEGKGRGKIKALISTPITRQGYRSGCLAEDFWSALGMPNTPATNPKKLMVVPFLTKNRNKELVEYLVDRRGHSFSTIACVHVAEQLAGIPWTQTRARQHVVNEVSQSLRKILIFNNNGSNPFQRWIQGHWYAQWTLGVEGHLCTLYVSIDVLEQMVKPRKGINLGWCREPAEITVILKAQVTDAIQVVADEHWKKMAGRLSDKDEDDQAPPESHNRFSTLLDEDSSLD